LFKSKGNMPRAKDEYLQKKVDPFNPENVNSVEEALEALQGCSFQGRNLGKGLEVWSQMVSEGPDCLKVLALAGSMVPSGMAEAICCAIERKMVDIIVSTAANITHDLANALLGQSHYIGSENETDDDELWDCRINRIYDTYLPEQALYDAQVLETEMLQEIYVGQDGPVPPSDVFFEIGRRLERRSMVSVAAANNVPLFCGAHSDSDFGLNLAEAKMKKTVNVVLDEIGDILKFAELTKKYERHGIIIVGGGVPRSWAQQIFPFIDQIDGNAPNRAYNYCLLIQTGIPYDGGMSGTLISADKTWGRYAKDVLDVNIWCDATIAFPLIVTGLVQRMKAGKL